MFGYLWFPRHLMSQSKFLFLSVFIFSPFAIHINTCFWYNSIHDFVSDQNLSFSSLSALVLSPHSHFKSKCCIHGTAWSLSCLEIFSVTLSHLNWDSHIVSGCAKCVVLFSRMWHSWSLVQFPAEPYSNLNLMTLAFSLPSAFWSYSNPKNSLPDSLKIFIHLLQTIFKVFWISQSVTITVMNLYYWYQLSLLISFFLAGRKVSN